jgi:hypothetical protein
MPQRSVPVNPKVEIRPYRSEDQSQVVTLWKVVFPPRSPMERTRIGDPQKTHCATGIVPSRSHEPTDRRHGRSRF